MYMMDWVWVEGDVVAVFFLVCVSLGRGEDGGFRLVGRTGRYAYVADLFGQRGKRRV